MYKSSLRSTTVQTRSQNPSCLCQIKKPQRTDPSIPQPSYPHSSQKIQGKRHVASVSRPSTCRITGHTPPGKASHIILSKSRDLASSTITSTVWVTSKTLSRTALPTAPETRGSSLDRTSVSQELTERADQN